MSSILRTLLFLQLLAAACCFVGCGSNSEPDAPDKPSPHPPEEQIAEANTTIARLKELYWRDNTECSDSVAPYRAGRHVVIAGRIVSSDKEGNISRCLIVQDTTAAILIYLNADNLHSRYKLGQELTIDVTGMEIGRRASLLYLMPRGASLELFEKSVRVDGVPEPSAIDTMLIRIPDLRTTGVDVRLMQSRLVRFNDVHFKEGGMATFASTRDLLDLHGNSIRVYTLENAAFADDILPEGLFDITGLLSTVSEGSATRWQILMRSSSDIFNLRELPPDNPLPSPSDTVSPGTGTSAHPYSVAKAMQLCTETKPKNVYVAGYIVGSVNGEDPAVDSHFSADYPSALNILIADSPDTRTITACMPVQLPYGAVRSALNLASNPGNIGKKVVLLGDLGIYLGLPALRSTSAYSF